MAEAEPESCSCSALRQAARHVTRLYDEALAPVGISINQYSILSKLRRHGPQTLQALAARLIMDRSTLGHLLRPLEGRGLVTIHASETDRRHRVIALTPVGEVLMETARPLWAAAEHAFADTFGTESAVALRTVLRRVTAVGMPSPDAGTPAR